MIQLFNISLWVLPLIAIPMSLIIHDAFRRSGNVSYLAFLKTIYVQIMFLVIYSLYMWYVGDEMLGIYDFGD